MEELATTTNPTTKKRKRESEVIVGGQYRLLSRIGCGSFGKIYNGTDMTNGKVRRNKLINYCLERLRGQ
jgi:hypothetical protein